MNSCLLKQIPEDFIVREVSSIGLADKGAYAIFKLKKKNYTSERAVQRIADALHVNRKIIGFAGNKDKAAVTEQSISVKGVRKERVEKIRLKDIELEFIGYSNEPISLGDLERNEFEIVVRNITKSPICLKRIVNYFGEQRFSRNNADVGKAIIKKDFKKAVDFILDSIGDDEKKVIEHLKKQKNDFVGALKKIPWKTLKLYVHAFQSKLWNETVKEIMEKGLPALPGLLATQKHEEFLLSEEPKKSLNIKVPLIGFATELEDKKLKKIVKKIMQNEQISFNDFVIRAIPDLSSEGNERNLYTEVKNLVIGNLEDDDLNTGKKKVKLTFSLSKGCYATEVVKQMFS